MQVNRFVQCKDFPCLDVQHESYVTPGIDLVPENVSMIVISEAAPANPADHYYGSPDSLFQQTSLLAFQDAGAGVSSFQEVVDLGIYFTTAIKCAKTGYGVTSESIERCSHLLEQEIALFPNVKVYLLMGDVAIKAFNLVARRSGGGRVIPAGSTYKIRKDEFYFKGRRVFPSYLQAGPSFFIEKSKRRMIAEDITQALKYVGAAPSPH